MEQLTEKVYECNLAVEAHMIVDLLSQAGISARVDGEFMQSIAGEIPMGSVVKVRVDPSRAAEARELIADWEKLQPPDPIVPPHFASGGRVVKRVVYEAGLPDHAEFDDDGDGRFERRVEYNAYGEPKL